MPKINKLQGYIVQNREYHQYFTVTVNALEFFKIVSYYTAHLSHIRWVATILQF